MKTKTTLAIFTLIFCVSFAAQAQSIDKKEDIANKREEIKAKIEQMSEKQKQAEEKKEEKVGFIKSLLQKFKKVEVENLKTKTLKNFEVAIRNLDNLSNRLASRIEKLETQGENLSESKALLEKANLQISVAKEESKKLSELIPDSFDKESKKEIKDSIKEQTKITKESIKSALASLTDVIVSIKGPINKNDIENISSTTENLKQDE